MFQLSTSFIYLYFSEHFDFSIFISLQIMFFDSNILTDELLLGILNRMISDSEWSDEEYSGENKINKIVDRVYRLIVDDEITSE